MDKVIYTPRLLQDRLKEFVMRIVCLTEKMPRSSAGFRISNQIIDSSGSMGANYSEAQASRSKKEFIAICGISLKENKETTFWLNVIKDANLLKDLPEIQELCKLIDESIQLERILAKIIINSGRNLCLQ